MAVGVALIPAHDADRLEAYGGVAMNRALVVGGWINYESVMSAVVHEVAGERCDCVTAEAAPVHSGIEEDVDGRVPVVGFLLFAVLDHPANRVTDESSNGHPGELASSRQRSRTSAVAKMRRSSDTCSSRTGTSTTRSPRSVGASDIPRSRKFPSAGAQTGRARTRATAMLLHAVIILFP